jgi:RHS repeat-associated protein
VDYSDASTADVSFTYTPAGLRASMVDGSGTTTYGYDALDRLTSRTHGGITLRYGYDLAGHQTSMTYPDLVPGRPGGVVTKAYDANGRLTSVTDWLGHSTTFTLGPDDTLDRQTLGNGVVSSFDYDKADRLTAISHAGPGSQEPFARFVYTRDAGSRRTGVTSTGVPADSHGYSYDALDQLTRRTTPGAAEASLSYSYDEADNLTGRGDGGWQTFDAANQLSTSSDISLVGTAVGHVGATPSVVDVDLPEGTRAGDLILVSSTSTLANAPNAPPGYTTTGVATSGTDAGSTRVAVYARKATATDAKVSVNFPTAEARSVTVSVYRGASAENPVDAVSSAGAPDTRELGIPALDVNLAGSRLVMFTGQTGQSAPLTTTPPVGMTARAVDSGRAGAASMTADQRLGRAGTTGARTVSTATAVGQAGLLVALRPAQSSYTYSRLGERTGVTSNGPEPSLSLGYDQAQRLSSFVAAGGITYRYTYDGDGLRTAKSNGSISTSYTWDDSATPSLLSDGTSYFIYGLGSGPIEQITAATHYYYVTDEHGSTRALTGPGGDVVATFSYDDFGAPTGRTGSVTTPFGYDGQYRDEETGYLHLRSRYYDPGTAQFITRDPLEQSTGRPYNYVGNDPINATDPMGLDGDGFGRHVKNGLTGLGDGLTSGLFFLGRKATGHDWVDYCDPWYAGGVVAGIGFNSLFAFRAPSGARSATATVWDDIAGTQPNIPGTVIPKSFELTAGGAKVWVHPNVTEHMEQYARTLTQQGWGPARVNLASQAQLSSLQSAVAAATANGVRLNERMVVGGWELEFRQRPGDLLPSLIHGLFRG